MANDERTMEQLAVLYTEDAVERQKSDFLETINRYLRDRMNKSWEKTGQNSYQKGDIKLYIQYDPVPGFVLRKLSNQSEAKIIVML